MSSYHWSNSSLGTHMQCARKYNLKYNLRLADGPRGPGAQRGIDLHEAIERYLKYTEARLPKEIEYWAEYLNTIRGGAGEALQTEATICLDRQWQEVTSDAPTRWSKAILDALWVIGGHAAVYDWKSGREYPEHTNQKEIYAAHVMAAYPEVERVQVIYVYVDRKAAPKSEFYSRDSLPQLKHKWGSYADHVETVTEFTPMPQFLCKYCHFSKSEHCEF